MTSNVSKDYLNPDAVGNCTREFLPDTIVEDNYTTPLDAPADWWQDLRVRDICVSVGEYEVFVHDVQAFAAKLEVSCSIVRPSALNLLIWIFLEKRYIILNWSYLLPLLRSTFNPSSIEYCEFLARRNQNSIFASGSWKELEFLV